MVKISIACVLCASASVVFGRDPALANAPYMDASHCVDARLDDLVSRMTLCEKVAAISTMKGFGACAIDGDRVVPSGQLRELYAKFPGCGLLLEARKGKDRL